MASSEKDIGGADAPGNTSEARSVSRHGPGAPGYTEPAPPAFKEGGYGWCVVAAVFVINMHTWGLNSSFAVFLAYYLRNNFFPGVTALQYAFVGGLSISISMLCSPLATMLIRWERCGTSMTIFIGVIFESIGFLGASFATELWHLLLSQGISFGVGMGLCFVASAPVPAQWFEKRRSLASSIAAAGSGFGGLCYSIATSAMIQSIGLAWTFRILAIICLVVNTVAAFVVKDRNAATGSVHVLFNSALLRRPEFLLYECWLILSMLAYVALVFSLVDYCQSIGLSAANASLVGALFNLGQGLGRPIIGVASDHYGRLNVAQISTALSGVLCLVFWLPGTRTLAACIVFALLCGPVAGVMWASCTPVCAEVVGISLTPSALSMSWLALVLPAMFSEAIALELKRPGSWGYTNIQVFIGCMYLGSSAFGWALRAWKLQEIEHARLAKDEREMAIRNDAVLDRDEHHHADLDTKSRFISMRGLWAFAKV
ncbi:major facilitator superfamily domain-containing protein [Microdochium trichocladiopsis]|uniref:Major facilitator superfamily domain-containing protein n=1 Tax=Microdochium trichocladiopsis TaxID=1682393 RepID=A0A9P9BMX4_9PEZI|nr:major facilitator superfamily domain-containing protein [Microdochium trichocladiopsis]KAH7026351.1 major facilitator superfamily domain-containing protein [Microdochium trichocladiopsis]